MRVLVIEDDGELAAAIAAGLRLEGLAVDTALDGDAGLERALVNDYDVIVLDRDLPGTHGDEVCGRLAGATRAGILMLTASGTVADRVAGLGRGADDYLPKPFAFAELVARIRALARRSHPAVPPVLAAKGITLDPARHVAARDGRPLDLGPKELALLELLMAANGRVVSAEELLERAWDEMADPFSTAVKVTVSRLRRKLGEPPAIETVAQARQRAAAADGAVRQPVPRRRGGAARHHLRAGEPRDERHHRGEVQRHHHRGVAGTGRAGPAGHGRRSPAAGNAQRRDDPVRERHAQRGERGAAALLGHRARHHAGGLRGARLVRGRAGAAPAAQDHHGGQADLGDEPA
jgi:DNA-binding response OmpR family regulator